MAHSSKIGRCWVFVQSVHIRHLAEANTLTVSCKGKMVIYSILALKADLDRACHCGNQSTLAVLDAPPPTRCVFLLYAIQNLLVSIQNHDY